MVSAFRGKQRTNGLGLGKRLASVSSPAKLIIILLIFFISSTSIAQIRSTRLELVTTTSDGEVLIHLRVPRGQTVESAEIVQGNNLIPLEAEPVQLPITQWVLLDASNEMVNLQSAVQSNVQRFLRNSENATGLIFFKAETSTLLPTDRPDQVDGFLTSYIATAGEPACLGDAIAALNENTRDLNRSWRILLITAGDFSRQSTCGTADFATLPAPVDVIAITETIDNILQDLVDRSGGAINSANLRTVEARINEIRTQWGQPTYALRGEWSEDWDASAPFDLNVLLSNGTEETTTLRLQEYNLPAPIEPTVTPSPIVLATIPPRDTATPEQTEAVVIANPTADSGTTNPDSAGGSDNVAFLLIIGAVLFVVGAVVLALALSRVRRSSPAHPSNYQPSFYESLENADVEAAMGATKIRERGIIEDADVGVTRIAPEAAGEKLDDTQMSPEMEADAEDELILTQVLSDARFKQMMEQSSSTDEIVGYMRLITEENESGEDFPLTEKGAVIGRSQDCDIQVKNDRAISRQHARLDVRNNGQVTISRLSAVNPVVVGGVQVSNRHPLKPNDVIHLSDKTRLIFIAKELEFNEDVTQF